MPKTPITQKTLRRFGPVLAIALALVAFYALGLNETISSQGFARHYQAILAWRAAHPLFSALLFVGIYTSIVAISVPASLWLSVPGGLLFGWFVGGMLSWLASLGGAILAFLAARTAMDPAKASMTGSGFSRFKAGLENNAFSTIIILRLMPLPFFVVNSAAGAFHVKVRTFAAASAIGLIPASFLFAALGQSAGEVLQAGGKLDLHFFQDPKILAVFAGFAALAGLPLLVRFLRKGGHSH